MMPICWPTLAMPPWGKCGLRVYWNVGAVERNELQYSNAERQVNKSLPESAAEAVSNEGIRLAVLSESPADEAAVVVIAEHVLEKKVVPFQPPLRRRPNGWPSVLKLLPVLTWFLYHRTDADGLVV